MCITCLHFKMKWKSVIKSQKHTKAISGRRDAAKTLCSSCSPVLLPRLHPQNKIPGASLVEGGTLHDPKGSFPLLKAQAKQHFCCFSLGLQVFPVMTSLLSLLLPPPFAWGALAEHLRQFWHCHTWVPAEGSVVFNMLVLLLYLSINKKFSH